MKNPVIESINIYTGINRSTGMHVYYRHILTRCLSQGDSALLLMIQGNAFNTLVLQISAETNSAFHSRSRYILKMRRTDLDLSQDTVQSLVTYRKATVVVQKDITLNALVLPFSGIVKASYRYV